MNLTQDFASANYIITGFRKGAVLINDEPHSKSLIVCPDTLISPWEVTHVDQLNETSLAGIVKLQPEVVLLGTGDKAIFPEAKIIAMFAQQHIGFEVMNTQAACRTYGVLIAEGRKAAAALIYSESITK